jgi:hypothetical protein
MSLQSLQDDMSRRASSMANMAKQISDPQQIQAIQQSLVMGVQNGSIESYIGIPLIEELTQKLSEVNAQMAQNMAGMGMPQGEQAPQQPIGAQVMQQAMQESQGLEALPSNLPQEYAGGGIIAFEHGGKVQHFETGNLVDERFRSEKKRLDEEARNEFRADVDPLDRFKFATKDREVRLSHADEAALDARAIREANAQAAAEEVAASDIKKVEGNPPIISEASPGNANNSAPAAEPVKTINPKSIQGMVKQYQDMMTAIPKGASQTEYEAYLKNRPKEAEATKKQDLLMALAQYGSNLAAGKSRNFFQNVGEAGIKTLPAVQEAYKQRRLADEMALRGRAELDRMSRAEQIEALKGGVGLYGTERQLEADATKAELQRANALEVARLQNQFKPTDLTNYVNDYVAQRKKIGDTRPVELIKVEGYDKYPGYDVRRQLGQLTASTALAGQNITREGQDIGAQSTALKEFNDLGNLDPAKKTYRDLARKDKENREKGIESNLAEEHKQNWIQKNTPRAGTKPAAKINAAPAQAKVMTQADVAATAKAQGISEAAVREAAKKAGYTIK